MKPATIYMLPRVLNGNKYIDLLVDSLEHKGAKIDAFSKKKMLKLRKNDVLHMHWPSFHYRGKNVISTYVKTLVFIVSLLYLRIRKVNLIWTVHNIWPHKTHKNWYDKIVRTIIARLCTNIIVMGETMKNEVIGSFGIDEDKMTFIPHGHYKGVYKGKGVSIRERYNVPEDAYVYGFIGQLSPYKGIDLLINSFRNMKDEEVHLIIAGRPSEDFDQRILNGLPTNVHVSLNYISEDEMDDYINAFDAIVLPYKEITTSGTAILAITYHKPVVAPNIGILKEYLAEDCAVLYESSDANGLINSMREVKDKRNYFLSSEGFERKLNELDWEKISDQTLGVYKKTSL